MFADNMCTKLHLVILSIMTMEFLLYSAVTGELFPNPSFTSIYSEATSREHHLMKVQLLTRDQKLTRKEGSTLRLRCNAQRRQKVVWTKDNRTISCPEGGCQRRLRIKSVTVNDSGVYQCYVSATHQLVFPIYYIQIRARKLKGAKRAVPVFYSWPSNNSVIAGSAATLRCMIYSPIELKVQWLRRLDNITMFPATIASSSLFSPIQNTIVYEGFTYQVLNTSGTARFANNTYLSKFMLAHANEEDSGYYVCLATNNHGFRYREAYICVLPRAVSGVLVPQGVQLVEVALILLVVVLVASPVIVLTYLAYNHRRGLLNRKHKSVMSSVTL